MKLETFNWEIRTLVAQAVDAYNDVVIRRYNDQKAVQDRIHVNFIYAPKSRVLYDIINKAAKFTLPVISLSIASITRNVSRVFNKIEGPYYNLGPNDTGFSHPLQPVPVDIKLNMSIVTRFQMDMDQILTNFMPYNDPYIVVSWPAPYTGHEIRNLIKWSGDVALTYPKDITQTDQYRCIADTGFTIEGWVFKDPSEPAGKIYKINTTFTSVSDTNVTYPTLLNWMDEDMVTDSFWISGRPELTMAIPYMTIPCLTGKQIQIYGNSFDTISGVYVSGNTPGMFTNEYFYNPLSGNYRVSAQYPGFSGVVVETWNVISNNVMTIELPLAVSGGYMDVIAYNEAGYGLLTKDAIRPTLNPYPSAMPEYSTYVEYQHPSVSGIYVIPFYDNCP